MSSKKSKSIPHWVLALNFVLVGGHQRVARFENGKYKELMTVDAFKSYVGNRRVKGISLDRGLGMAWLQHSDRRTYKGITFVPGDSAPIGYLNLWRGFAVNRKPGDVMPFLAYLRQVICAGDDELAQWLLAWLAHLVQRPFDKPGTAIVMIGAQGTGKSTLVEMLKHLLGDHAIVLPSADYSRAILTRIWLIAPLWRSKRVRSSRGKRIW